MVQFISGLCGGGVTGLICGLVFAAAVAYFKHALAERDALLTARSARWQSELDTLRDKLQEHLRDDSPEKTEKEFASIRGELTRLSDQLARNQENSAREMSKISAGLGEIKGALAGINTWMQNTNEVVQRHVTNMEIHG